MVPNREIATGFPQHPSYVGIRTHITSTKSARTLFGCAMGTIPLVTTYTFPSAVLTAVALGGFPFAFLGFRKTRHHDHKWGRKTNDC